MIVGRFGATRSVPREPVAGTPGSHRSGSGGLSTASEGLDQPRAERLEELHRLAGPPGAPVLEVVEEDEWRDDVADLARKVEDGHEPPPVIVTYRDGELVVNDGNHRIEAIRRARRTEVSAVVGFEHENEREAFIAWSDDVET